LIVLTNDLDFGSILAATNGEKPSVVQVRPAELRPEVRRERRQRDQTG
jgi:predicted nuclease of predicted toxin-antitoxin system